MFIIWCGLFSLLVFLFIGYVYSIYKFNKCKKSGIQFLEPYPYLGNLFKSILGQEALAVTMKNIYDTLPNERYFAFFELTKPTIVLKDLTLIKNITIKDFNNFQDIPFIVDEDIDPVFGKMLFVLKGPKWHQMRTALSPAFTSSKMKNMFQFMTKCAARSIDYYVDHSSATGALKIDMNDVTTRFTSDVIAATTFGFDVDSLKDRSNDFYTSTSSFSKLKLLLLLKFTGYRVFPKLMKILNIKLLSGNSVNYLRELVLDEISKRETSIEQRLDMLHLLIQAKNGTLKNDELNEESLSLESLNCGKQESVAINWTNDDIIAQAFIFIIAGYTSSATALNFLFYELALNKDIQEKLQREIDDILAEKDDVDYYTILKMKYLDMVVSEVLRKWPPIPISNRLCTQTYHLGPVKEGSDISFTVSKGDFVWIPIHSLHMDPTIWSNPERFDPERFSDENKKSTNSTAYLAFGSGPRNCLGSRFALLKMKVLAFYFLSKFNFDVCVKTEIPIKLSTKTHFLESANGYWLEMKLRNR